MKPPLSCFLGLIGGNGDTKVRLFAATLNPKWSFFLNPFFDSVAELNADPHPSSFESVPFDLLFLLMRSLVKASLKSFSLKLKA